MIIAPCCCNLLKKGAEPNSYQGIIMTAIELRDIAQREWVLPFISERLNMIAATLEHSAAKLVRLEHALINPLEVEYSSC